MQTHINAIQACTFFENARVIYANAANAPANGARALSLWRTRMHTELVLRDYCMQHTHNILDYTEKRKAIGSLRGMKLNSQSDGGRGGAWGLYIMHITHRAASMRAASFYNPVSCCQSAHASARVELDGEYMHCTNYLRLAKFPRESRPHKPHPKPISIIKRYD